MVDIERENNDKTLRSKHYSSRMRLGIDKLIVLPSIRMFQTALPTKSQLKERHRQCNRSQQFSRRNKRIQQDRDVGAEAYRGSVNTLEHRHREQVK